MAAVVGQLITRLLAADGPVEGDPSRDDPAGDARVADGGGEQLVTEAERLLATLDGLTMHALLQPAWLTREMCRDVLESHLAGLRRTAGASH